MTIWLEGENGAVMAFSEPLPPVIEAQRARGTLKPCEPPAAGVPDTGEKLREAAERHADGPETAAVPLPSPEASSAAWHEYALAQGMPAGKCHNMNKAQLIKHYTGLRAVS